MPGFPVNPSQLTGAEDSSVDLAFFFELKRFLIGSVNYSV